MKYAEPSQMTVQEPVQAAIWHCLNHYAYQDATFLAERLCAEVESDDSVFMLATCYYRSSQVHQAYWVLHARSSKSPQCRYLLAKCAFELKKYGIVEAALNNENFTETRHLDAICAEFGEVACFALQLIAKVCTQTERHEMAAEANRRALKLNPFLWQSFADLCNRGHTPDPQQVFQFTSSDTFATCQGNNLNAFVALNNSCTMNGHLLETTDQSLHQTPVDVQTPQHSYNFVTPNGAMAPPSTRTTADESSQYSTGDSQSDVALSAQTPFRKQFKYLSAISPSTPSFGVLPISSPSFNDTPAAITPTGLQQQQQAMLAEVNDQKSLSKKIKGGQMVVGTLISRKDSPLQLSKPIFSQTGNITPRTPNSNTLGAQNVRRSSRLSFSNCSAVKENNKSATTINKFATPRSPPRKTKQRITKMNLTNTALNELNNEKQQQSSLIKLDNKEKVETITSAAIGSTPTTTTDTKVLYLNQVNSSHHHHHLLQLRRHSADGLMTLLRDLGAGYLQLTQYDCAEAVETLSAVPPHHFASSWVQSMIAKAHYETQNYEASAKIFQDIHKREPHRMHMMEIYSSVLWHLHKDVQLSALAQDLLAQDKRSAVTWCVSGNCFSLHKEHDMSIKFFERAVQVDPDFSYSYALLGHELVITEELEKAMSCFRTAILKDARHYNAWFGIGTIFSKQERYSLAEIHYQHAARINPKNSVILVHIGTMQFALKRPEQALNTLNAAIALDPKNPLSKFHRGSLYFKMGKYNEALEELEELKQVLPKESTVHFHIGRIHKKMGNVAAALMHFNWATDLDPRGANNQIKDAFDANMSQSGGQGGGGGGGIATSANQRDGDAEWFGLEQVTLDDSAMPDDLEPITEELSDDSTQPRGEPPSGGGGGLGGAGRGGGANNAAGVGGVAAGSSDANESASRDYDSDSY